MAGDSENAARCALNAVEWDRYQFMMGRMKTKTPTGLKYISPESILVQRDFARLRNQRVTQGRAKALFFPSCKTNAPDKFKWRFHPFGCNRLLQCEELVIPFDGLAAGPLRRSPGVPLIFEIPIEQFL